MLSIDYYFGDSIDVILSILFLQYCRQQTRTLSLSDTVVDINLLFDLTVTLIISY